VAFDPFLYLALAVGLLAGWLVRPTSPWVGRLTLATIVVLVGLLGASLTGLSPGALLFTIPLALGFVALVLGLTAAACLLLVRLRPPRPSPPSPEGPRERVPFSVGLLVALAVGYAVGRAIAIPTALGIPLALYVLLFLVGFGLRLTWARLPSLWVPLSAAVAGAAGAGLAFAAATGTPLSVSLATSMGFGFYSLTGPLVEARVGAVLGLLAFLTNFLRENLTMVLSPLAGRRLRGEGLAAWGGATSMDTTLFFVTRYGDRDAGTLAIANGLILTITASLVVPLLLALPT
jgi:uncharacterized membrane protein YbjE (DUF340 family)